MASRCHARYVHLEKVTAMSAPIKSGGDLSRRVQKQSTSAAAGSAVITLELLNLFSAIFAGIMSYAFSHPRRMYEVGAWIVGLPTLVAFLQGSFYINGPPLTSTVVMFVLVGMTVVMKFHESVINELHGNRFVKSTKHRQICCDGLIGGITALTLLLWGLTVLALWWSPDTSEMYRWFGLSAPDKITCKRRYELCVLLIVMIVMCNSSLHLLLRWQVYRYLDRCRQSLPPNVDVHTNVERLWTMAKITRDEKEVREALRRIKSEHSTPVLLGVTTVITGIYHLAISTFHGVSVPFGW